MPSALKVGQELEWLVRVGAFETTQVVEWVQAINPVSNRDRYHILKVRDLFTTQQVVD